MAIPAGSQNGRMLRVRDEGIPVHDAHRGDLYLKLLVQVPQKLSRKGRELLEQLREVEGEDSEPKPIKLSELGKS